MKFPSSPHACRTFPEEILEYIISLAMYPYSSPKSSPLSLLLVCKTFYRIAKPLLYSFLHLRSRRQSAKIAEIFSAQPTLSTYIRSIRVDGPAASQAFLVVAKILMTSKDWPRGVLDVVDVRLVDERILSSIRTLDVAQLRDDLERLNSALRTCPDTRQLIVRQDGYISFNSTVSFIQALASGVRRWHSLVSHYISITIIILQCGQQPKWASTLTLFPFLLPSRLSRTCHGQN